MLEPGQEIEVAIEKPAAGGRMIARHEGQVVLVAGAVPGERVVARIERAERRLAFAAVVDVTEPSPDRRAGFPDPLCGGCVFSHISYERQLGLKAEIVKDAFDRIGRISSIGPVPVLPSPEHGYRMRARLHVDNGGVGFHREGTHVLCDPQPSRQMTEAALSAVRTAVDIVERSGARASAVEIAENIAGEERALSIEVDDVAPAGRGAATAIVESGAAMGTVIHDGRSRHAAAGELGVADSLETLTNGRATDGELRRHPESFFQGNRYLVPALVTAVLDAVAHRDAILDLYAGVGLFSIALAATAGRQIVAVEGDRSSGADLQRNAGPFGGTVTIALESVEDYLETSPVEASTVVVDPPRTGMSPQALAALTRRRSDRIIYVSCDPATMARDARKLLDAGYRLESIRAFDLFPNTPHVESLGVFSLP